MRQRLAGLFLLVISVLNGAPAERAPLLRSVSVGSVSIESALILPLAGAGVTLLRERLAGEVRMAGVHLGDGSPLARGGYLEVAVNGSFASAKSVAYSVEVSLKRPAAKGEDPDAPVTLGRRLIQGAASPAALSIQVLVAMEEQAAQLLREHARGAGA